MSEWKNGNMESKNGEICGGIRLLSKVSMRCLAVRCRVAAIQVLPGCERLQIQRGETLFQEEDGGAASSSEQQRGEEERVVPMVRHAILRQRGD